MPPKPPDPKPGDKFTYNPDHGQGLGENAAGEDFDAEMAMLDLKPGEVVTLLAFDADSDWPIAQWTDDAGTIRLTTLDPVVFADHFDRVTAEVR